MVVGDDVALGIPDEPGPKVARHGLGIQRWRGHHERGGGEAAAAARMARRRDARDVDDAGLAPLSE